MECKIWTGAVSGGYGTITREGKQWVSHRWIWTQTNGPIPEGMEIHHTCGNRLCYEITHLEALTPQEHSDRHHGTVCPKCGGTDWMYNQDGRYRVRRCRPCRNKSWRDNYWRRNR